MTQDTTTTSGAADLLDLIEAYAEARHRQGHSSYNAQTAVALQAVKDALAAGQATAAQAVVQDDLITIRKPTTSAEMLWLLKLAHLVISDVGKTLEESFAPAQPVAEPAKSAAYAALSEPADIIAGALQISRGHAYELMREAVATTAQEDSAPSRFGSPELQAMIIARCVEKDQADSVQEDAARYRLLRRGRHWSVIDGIGNDLLRAEALDAAVDAALKQGGAT